jgi:uroporphyrinogen decarboxylase
MTTPTSRERMLAACRREPVDRAPAWMMRQAGRYLPEYRALREGRDFLDMVHAPELAAELTLQPIRRFGMDAAVIFSDILVPPAAMGVGVRFESGRGPVLDPVVRSAADVEALRDFDPARETGFLGEAIRAVRGELGDERAIVGFCGAPWTTASYMIEGGSSRNYEHAKAMLWGEPETFARLVERLVDNLVPYLAMQVEAGADCLQVFDSWGGALDAATYERALLPEMTRLVAGAKATGVPVILYANGCSHLLDVLVRTGADVLGLDWRCEPADAIARFGDRVAFQGNLDPCLLFAPPGVVARETRAVLERFRAAAGHVFNLGSGILPGTPVESVEAMFETALAGPG